MRFGPQSRTYCLSYSFSSVPRPRSKALKLILISNCSHYALVLFQSGNSCTAEGKSDGKSDEEALLCCRTLSHSRHYLLLAVGSTPGSGEYISTFTLSSPLSRSLRGLRSSSADPRTLHALNVGERSIPEILVLNL